MANTRLSLERNGEGNTILMTWNFRKYILGLAWFLIISLLLINNTDIENFCKAVDLMQNDIWLRNSKSTWHIKWATDW